MFSRLASLFRKRPPAPESDPAPSFSGSCPVCEGSLVEHPTWLLASAMSSKAPNRVAELESLVSDGQWTRAAEIRECKGDQDEILFVALKCPVAGTIALKKMHSVFDLWRDDQCLADLLIDEAGQRELDTLAAGRWKVPGVRVG